METRGMVVIFAGPGVPERAPLPPSVDWAFIATSQIAVTWVSWVGEVDSKHETVDYGGAYEFEAQWQRLGSPAWKSASVTRDIPG